jgi:hypothetical protein
MVELENCHRRANIDSSNVLERRAKNKSSPRVMGRVAEQGDELVAELSTPMYG